MDRNPVARLHRISRILDYFPPNPFWYMIASIYSGTKSLRICYWGNEGGPVFFCGHLRHPERPGGPRFINYTHIGLGRARSEPNWMT